jgi:carboxyl-terminal processing protease
MKSKSMELLVAGGMVHWLTLGAGLMLMAAAPLAQGASASEVLEQGIYAEETKGDLKTASQLYQQIVDDASADRILVAQAQLRLGLCELKQGNKPRAISALEKLTQEFPDRDKFLSIVEQHMPRLLDELVMQIEQNYLREIDRGELMETAIHAIVGKLDARVGFLRTNDMEFIGHRDVAQLNVGMEQKLAGIGAQLKLDEDSQEVVVETPLPGSPALKGGLRAGDRILEIDGRSLPAGKSIDVAAKLLRGPAGTAVTVGVRRAGSEELRQIELVRDTILLASVMGDRHKPDGSWEFMLDEAAGVGYIRLAYIGKRSPEEMQAALNELTARGLKGLILDLRNSPGGLLGEAVAISDLFVKSGRIITVKGRNGEQTYEAKSEGTFPDFPMAVLVNRKTASAVEIIAACLQDHERAVVVGERTFGQGLVKSLIQLKDGIGVLKLPVAAYFRPNGKNMNRYPGSKEADDWGIRPDPGYEVTMTDEELKEYENYRHERDRLSSAPQAEAGFRDGQLEKALGYVRMRLGRK